MTMSEPTAAAVAHRVLALWDAHGRPVGCDSEFRYQARQEMILAERMRHVCTDEIAKSAHLHAASIRVVRPSVVRENPGR
jgi:hypothetical protein